MINKKDFGFSKVLLLCNYTFVLFFFLLKINERKSNMFITAKNATRITSVSTGFTGASVASSIIGKPNTIAGKFW